MRIAYVNCDHGIALGAAKGATTHIVEMVRALSDEGARLRLLCARVEATPDALRDVPVLALSPAQALAADKEQIRREQALRMVDQLVAMHQHWPFDAIYERYSLWSDAGVQAGRALGVPVMVEVNAPLVREQLAYRRLNDPALARSIEQSVFHGADHLFAVSSGLRDWMIAEGVDGGRVSVLGNGVDGAMFQAGEPLRATATTIGFTGSLKQWHGIRELLQAFALVRQQRADAHLLIVGDGPMRPWLEGFIEGAGLDPSVTISGWIDHRELPTWIERMDIATAPYPPSQDFYFSPLKLFEYMAMGRPIVASAIGQVAEVLADELDALLIRPGDPQALAGALLRLLDDHALRLRLGAAARQRSAEHSWQRNAQRVLAKARELGQRAEAA
ncbi:MAG: glycosyltransferase [Burkholderiaceae bacterium]